MRQVRLDPSVQAGFAGAPADAAMPARFGAHAMQDTGAEIRPRRSLLATALRMVRDAAIAVVLMATVPIAIVAARGSTFMSMGSFGSYVHQSTTYNERWRPLMLPSDPSITPERAGLAFAALQPQKATEGFPARAPSIEAAKTWRDLSLRPDMFVNATPGATSHVPSAKGILGSAVQGLAPSELEFLRALATAPVWREFDIVARAPAVDILGGQFTGPFSHDVFPDFRPSSFQEIREISSAAVSRAAYHLAMGHRDSAEVILRSIVSVGFAMIDNGTDVMDEVIGVQTVDVGRVALRQYYELQHDPRATSLTAPPRIRGAPDAVRDAAEFRALQIARLGDQTRHRGERFASLGLLTRTSCTNVRDLVAGPRADVVAALEKAKRDLPRYASERALVGQIEDARAHELPKEFQNPVSDLAVSAASVAGVAFHNPRFAQCARILTVW